MWPHENEPLSCYLNPTSAHLPSPTSRGAGEGGTRTALSLCLTSSHWLPFALTLDALRDMPCSSQESQASWRISPPGTDIGQTQTHRKATAPWIKAENFRRQLRPKVGSLQSHGDGGGGGGDRGCPSPQGPLSGNRHHQCRMTQPDGRLRSPSSCFQTREANRTRKFSSKRNHAPSHPQAR